MVGSPDIVRATDSEMLRSELKEKDKETRQLKEDQESSLNKMGGLRESVNAAASTNPRCMNDPGPMVFSG